LTSGHTVGCACATSGDIVTDPGRVNAGIGRVVRVAARGSPEALAPIGLPLPPPFKSGSQLGSTASGVV
jgi:hypothetical protein